MLIEGVNSGMSDANALKEELAEVLGGLRRYKRPFPAMFGIAPGEFFTLGMIERYQDVRSGCFSNVKSFGKERLYQKSHG